VLGNDETAATSSEGWHNKGVQECIELETSISEVAIEGTEVVLPEESFGGLSKIFNFICHCTGYAP
jgi:hypothetical protein